MAPSIYSNNYEESNFTFNSDHSKETRVVADTSRWAFNLNLM